MLARTPIEDLMYDKATIIGWLESKDPNQIYDYVMPHSCVLAQFLTEHGTDPEEFYKSRYSCIPPGVWNNIARSTVIGSKSTFGEALARARKLLK